MDKNQYLNNGIKIKENMKIPTLDGLPSKNYKYKGINFNLDNIMTYLEYDYWFEHELDYDFWLRFNSHRRIYYQVMEINGYGCSKNIGIDNTEKIKKQIHEESINYPNIELNLDLNWNDE